MIYVSKLVISLKKDKRAFLKYSAEQLRASSPVIRVSSTVSSIEELSRQILRHRDLIFHVRAIIALENYLTKQLQMQLKFTLKIKQIN